MDHIFISMENVRASDHATSSCPSVPMKLFASLRVTTTRGENGFTVTCILSINILKEIALRLFCNSFAARVAVERKCHLGKGRKRVKPDRPAATHCSFHHRVPPSSVISRLAAWLYSSLSRSLSLPLISTGTIRRRLKQQTCYVPALSTRQL